MIKNIRNMKDDAGRIVTESIKSVDPGMAVLRMVKLKGLLLSVGRIKINLKNINNIYVIGLGKASSQMAKPLEKILGSRLTGGIINTKYGHNAGLKKIKVNECGHPVPDRNGLKGAGEICDFAKQAGENDIVFCLISGGGSALFPLPAGGIAFSDKQKATQLLLKSGATIQEVNTVRKHISSVKGGRLAKLISPARVVSLILSDVIGDDMGFIASGVTSPDPTTFRDCVDIIKRYRLMKKMPLPVIKYLSRGIKVPSMETPKPGDPVFKKVSNVLVGTNFLACNAAMKKAKSLGYNTLLLSTAMEGETREIAKAHSAIAREVLLSGNPVGRPACIISGGETTVTVRGKGKGGRNMEFCLACVEYISGLKNIVIASVGTDGTDGPTDSAGAVVDSSTFEKALKKRCIPAEYLGNNDSYNFFKRCGGLYITGPTGTNVMDIRIVLVT
ncbi:MAG: glycerate kinase [Candidatus Aureabacteria bacterium]|nr:glycerate kinase [Candidatus Auribacterota bacterium]